MDWRADHNEVVVTQCLNGFGLLAAPQAFAAATKGATGDLVAGIKGAANKTLDLLRAGAPVAVLSPFDADTTAVVTLLEQWVEAADGWEKGPPPQEVLGLSRQVLGALGVPAPHGGWGALSLDGQ